MEEEEGAKNISNSGEATSTTTTPAPKKSKKGCIVLVIVLLIIMGAFVSRGFFSLILGTSDDHDIPIPASLDADSKQNNTIKSSPAVSKKSVHTSPKATTPAPTKTASLSKEETVEYLIAVGMKGDDGKGPDKVLSKWIKKSVVFKVLSTPSAESSQCVNTVISQFNSLINPVSFSRDDATSNFDITIRFITQVQLNEVYGRMGTPARKNLHGYMTYETNHNGSEELTGGHIYIATNSPISEVNRCAVIRHEMTHTIGLPFNSGLHDYSIFNVGVVGRSDYIKIDKEVIKLLYNSGIPCGSTEAEVRSFFGI